MRRRPGWWNILWINLFNKLFQILAQKNKYWLEIKSKCWKFSSGSVIKYSTFATKNVFKTWKQKQLKGERLMTKKDYSIGFWATKLRFLSIVSSVLTNYYSLIPRRWFWWLITTTVKNAVIEKIRNKFYSPTTSVCVQLGQCKWWLALNT